MKALHIITGLGVGGAEQQLRLLLRHLPMPCDVVTLTDAGTVAEEIRADGTRVVELGMRGNRDLPALPRLVGLVRAGGYDLVHTHLYRACLYGRVAARLAGVRAVVATEHSLGEHSIEGRRLSPGIRSLYLAAERLGSATVAVSGTVAQRLQRWGVAPDRVHTVPNGIDAGRFRFDPRARARVRAQLGIPTGAFVVGAVGRLVPGKRFDTLVGAVAELPDARLLLAGDGPERAALEKRVAQCDAFDRIRLLGECGGAVAPDAAVAPADGGVPGIPELLSAVDVFVSTSDDESFGLSVLEALASGLPVLHVTCPAIDELPPGEAPGARRIGAGGTALAAALRECREAGNRRLPVPPVVARYDIATSVERLLDVYESVAGQPLRRRPPALSPPELADHDRSLTAR
ncbi:glycosyltransferase [Streptomyces sulphureus]|uniref:glycosyltransferase n=1 Tax=Streptomyces sulphureus TaxID=47758 RepID=UPI0003664921|nr:glycosyltransferase [Streptomyces sulphureus]